MGSYTPLCISTPVSRGRGGGMPIHSFMQFGAFDPETIAAMSEALETALIELQPTGPTEATQEAIARRIIAAATMGERDPVRLLAVALDQPPGG
jgi:hypothetical protein